METAYQGKFLHVDHVEDPRSGRIREVVRANAGPFSVAFLIYIPEDASVILTQQVRPAMISADNSTGLLVEVPAGRCDKPGETIKGVIKREGSEEVGAEIGEDQIELLNGGEPLAMSPGVLDEKIYLARIILRRGQLAADREFGCPNEGEHINRIRVPVSDIAMLRCVDLKTKTLLLHFLLTQHEALQKG